ncbi:MAG TPA: alpha/beta hydrolase [Steroidobacteraceae bacterium]|jgi:pimeloyl-ACP methyl ester carboxylesterase|nr:alpha/beta hydrolase [Steroidobacteraceae bacterium]
MDFIEYRRIRANGIDFNVAMAGSGERLALCLHGFPESSFSWRHQLPLLARLGYRAWAPDLRGYGGSTRPLGVGAYALRHLEEDVAALIEAAEAKEVVLVGHDWGAVIAWYYAMFGRIPISRLIIMNVPHPALAEKGLRTLRQLKKSWYIFFFQLPWIPEWGLARNGCEAIGRVFRGMAVDKSRFPDEVLRVYREAAAGPGALTAMLNYYRALLRGFRRNRRRGIAKIHVPTLMIWGELDTALGKELTCGTDRYVSDLTLRYLPNVSHWVQQEAPATVNAMIESWLLGASVPYAPGAPAPDCSPQEPRAKPSTFSGGS